MSADGAGMTPEGMRQAMAGYIRGIHAAYADVAEHLPPAERAALPLYTADRLTVIAVGTRMLHVIATTDPLPAPSGQEASLADSLDGLAWSVRFFDPVIIPALGLIDESAGPAQDDVRRVLGVTSVVYHLAVPPGGSLTAHHAGHAGTGLAHAHAAAIRDLEELRAHARVSPGLLDEFAAAILQARPRSALLVGRAIAPGTLPEMPLEPAPDLVAVRRAVLDEVRGGRG